MIAPMAENRAERFRKDRHGDTFTDNCCTAVTPNHDLARVFATSAQILTHLPPNGPKAYSGGTSPMEQLRTPASRAGG
jgi:hypothetical protein